MLKTRIINDYKKFPIMEHTPDVCKCKPKKEIFDRPRLSERLVVYIHRKIKCSKRQKQKYREKVWLG